MKKIIILLLIISALALQSEAQKVTSVKATKQDNKVIVSYKIEGGVNDRVYSPTLYYSTDGGGNYKKCKSTKAKYAKPNQTAQITWNVTNDIDYFVSSNIVFKVNAYGFWNSVKAEATIRGKTYKTIKIGQQEWMAENLAYKINGGCWAYDNNSSNVTKYGYLYNWEAAKTVAPKGWHLPSDEDWKELEIFLGMRSSVVNNMNTWRGSPVGNKLKSTSGWNKGGNGNNSSGFNALPGGYYQDKWWDQYDRVYRGDEFIGIGSKALFYSSTADRQGYYIHYRGLQGDYSEVNRNCDFNGGIGLSVRLIRD